MEQQRILIFHLGSLGDTLVALPALWVVRENFPDANITMLSDVKQDKEIVHARQILDGSGIVDEYLSYVPHRITSVLKLFAELRAKRYSCLVYLANAYSDDLRILRDSIFFRMAGVKQIIGMSGFPRRSARKNADMSLPSVGMAESLLARLREDNLFPRSGTARIDINISETERASFLQHLSGLPLDGGRPWLALGLGSKMPCKVWPYSRYLQTVTRLISEFDLWPVVFGAKSDSDLGENLVRDLGRGYVFAGRLGIRDSMIAMERCVLFLGNDTGTMHMAASAGIRCVVPFSSRDVVGKWNPYGDGHVVLRTEIDCQGCMLEECVERKMECIHSISVSQVVAACSRILSELLPARVSI